MWLTVLENCHVRRQSYCRSAALPAVLLFLIACGLCRGDDPRTKAITGQTSGLTAAGFAPTVLSVVDENAPADTVVCEGSAHAEGRTRFRIDSGNHTGAFRIDPETGRIEVANPEELDFERRPEFSLVVSAQMRDADSDPFWLAFEASAIDAGATFEDLAQLREQRASTTVEVALRDLNEAPHLPPTAFRIPESAAQGVVIGTVSATDPDRDEVLTYSITGGNEEELFCLDPLTGQISAKETNLFDFEERNQFELEVAVSDDAGQTSTADVVVSIVDVNEPPVVTETNLHWIVSNDAAPVGIVAAVDPDKDSQISFELGDDPTRGAFEIDNISGTLSVADPARLRAFDGSECVLTINVWDDACHVTSVPVAIEVELPSRSIPSTITASETTAAADRIDPIKVESDAQTNFTPPTVATATRVVFALSMVAGLMCILVAWFMQQSKKSKAKVKENEMLSNSKPSDLARLMEMITPNIRISEERKNGPPPASDLPTENADSPAAQETSTVETEQEVYSSVESSMDDECRESCANDEPDESSLVTDSGPESEAPLPAESETSDSFAGSLQSAARLPDSSCAVVANTGLQQEQIRSISHLLTDDALLELLDASRVQDTSGGAPSDQITGNTNCPAIHR